MHMLPCLATISWLLWGGPLPRQSPLMGPTPWLLAVFLDVTQKGVLLDAAAAVQRYPAVRELLDAQENGVDNAGVLRVLCALARTMVLAHQRRGESDFVAHWLYQLMALDAGAQEWEHVLR